jgi:hypothetical protein
MSDLPSTEESDRLGSAIVQEARKLLSEFCCEEEASGRREDIPVCVGGIKAAVPGGEVCYFVRILTPKAKRAELLFAVSLLNGGRRIVTMNCIPGYPEPSAFMYAQDEKLLSGARHFVVRYLRQITDAE